MQPGRGVTVVRISRQPERWQAGGCNDIKLLTYEQLALPIKVKNRRVSEYRDRVPQGWQVLLLFATLVPVLWTVSTPPEVTAWRFPCGFDRVL